MSINIRLHQAKEIYDQLKQCVLIEFVSFVPKMIADKSPGVYAIYQKQTMETLYVEKTTNLKQRLYTNHLMGSLTNARLKKYIIDDENFPSINDKDEAKQWIKSNCCFQYVIAHDYRERGHIEGLISYLLNARYVDKEH